MMLYACGGTGINICKWHDQAKGTKETGMALIDIAYIDTSSSNLAGTNSDSVYLVQLNKSGEGSGKTRNHNYEEISEQALDILQKHPAKDINVIVSSGSGGSGSVIGPVLVSQLLEQGKPVIVVLVGGTDSLKELENTIKTIESYESIATFRKKPVVCVYYENTAEMLRNEVNSLARSSLGIIAAYFSGENSELDSTDLYNWLNYNNVTTFEPKLVALQFYQGKVTVDKSATLISAATLAVEGVNTSIDHPIEYQCVGYVDEAVFASTGMESCMHAVIVDGVMGKEHLRLSALQADRQKIINARVVKSTIISSKSKPTNDGLVL